MTELRAVGDLGVLDQRPAAGAPRDYRFPAFSRERLANGLTIVQAHLPGRPLLMAQLVLLGGAGSEPAERAGVTALTARAMTEGTQRHDAMALIEASERLGAELHAEAGWESLSVSVEVPRSRLAAALGLLVETALEPAFPEAEVERLREERLNDLLQAMADPRRRAERAYAETIYAPSSPFSRPLGGLADTVERLERRHLVERHAELLDPTRATLIVAGDLDGISLADMAQSQLGGWSAASIATASEHQSGATFDDSAHPAGPRTVLVDRPGSPQTEIRIGHVGLSRRIPDFHAVAVMAAMLGGLFNSRLNRLLREERGYTYGASAGFELRRAAGPFAVRTAVQTEVTVPAVEAVLAELRRIREGRVEEAELKEARDYLIGVFPLRFEAPPQVIAAIAGLIIFGLPDDELDRYRPAVASVTADDVLSAAGHVRPDDASIVLVGDAMSIEGGLRDAGLPQLTVVRDPLPTELAEEAETR